MRILFTGVGRRIELLQAFRNAALVLNKELKIYGADMAGTAPALAYCDYTRRVVAMKDPSYIQNLIDICVADHIDLLIPTIDTDLLVLSENKEKFEAIGTRVMISAPDKIRICRDKNNTSQFFVDCGLHESSVDTTMERFLQEIIDMTEYIAFYCGHWHIEKQDGKIRFLFHDVISLEE